MLGQATRLSRAGRRLGAAALSAAVLITGVVAHPRAATRAVVGACSPEDGQALIDQGRYKKAVAEFTCVIETQPTGVDGYRGRIEAQLLLGSVLGCAARLHACDRVRAARAAGCGDRHPCGLRRAPGSRSPERAGAHRRELRALVLFQYAQATQLLNTLLSVSPDDVYGNLFRGSSGVLGGSAVHGVPELDRAIELAPQSPDVRFIVADAYTYGLQDPDRAFAEATLALAGGLDTPRVHAMLGSAWHAFGNQAFSAWHIARHIELVAGELVSAPTLGAGTSLALPLVPGQVYEIPVPVIAGETVSISTGSHDYWDTILVVLGPTARPSSRAMTRSSITRRWTGWLRPRTCTHARHALRSVNTGMLRGGEE